MRLKVAADDHPESFFNVTRPALRLAQWFGLFPSLSGLNHRCYTKVTHSWLSLKSIYCLYALAGNMLCLLGTVVPLLAQPLSFDGVSTAYFYLTSLATFLSLGCVSTMWLSLCREFNRMETLFLRHGFPKRRLRFQCLMAFFMAAASVEHFSGIIQAFIRIQPCAEVPGHLYYVLESFFLSNYKKVFTVVDYSFWMGFPLFHLNLIFTFAWNFLDLLLAFVAMSISARFNQLNEFLAKHRYQARDPLFWQRARMEFNCLARLIKNVNSSMGGLVALSFLSNVIFICKQLLRSLNPRSNVFQEVYFMCSFGFLLFRTVFSSLCMAEVHNSGKKCKSVLFCVPSRSYCAEVERFLAQVEADDVALTGLGIFTAGRGALLSIAGTIITYEIVLLQFNSFIGSDLWPSAGNKTYCIKRN